MMKKISEAVGQVVAWTVIRPESPMETNQSIALAIGHWLHMSSGAIEANGGKPPGCLCCHKLLELEEGTPDPGGFAIGLSGDDGDALVIIALCVACAKKTNEQIIEEISFSLPRQKGVSIN